MQITEMMATKSMLASLDRRKLCLLCEKGLNGCETRAFAKLIAFLWLLGIAAGIALHLCLFGGWKYSL